MAEQSTEAEADQAFEGIHVSIKSNIGRVEIVSQMDAKAIQAELRSELTEMRATIRLLEEFAEEQDSEEETSRLFLKVSNWRRLYEQLQADLRRAILQRQKHAEEVAINERKALMGSPEARERQQKMRSEADIAGTSESITASLQRTRQQMAQELEHTAATLAAMDVSDEVLKEARNEFQGHKASHKRSHQLLGTMRRHSVMDFLTLWGGISIFMMVVIYIVAKRSFYFVPNFARNMVMVPFRARNNTSNLKGEHPLPQEGVNLGALQDYEHHLVPNDGPEQVVEETPDLQSSADAEVGLSEGNLTVAEASVLIEQAFKEAELKSSEQAAEAHPGVAVTDIPMQASSAETELANQTAVSGVPKNESIVSLGPSGSQDSDQSGVPPKDSENDVMPPQLAPADDEVAAALQNDTALPQAEVSKASDISGELENEAPSQAEALPGTTSAVEEEPLQKSNETQKASKDDDQEQTKTAVDDRIGTVIEPNAANEDQPGAQTETMAAPQAAAKSQTPSAEAPKNSLKEPGLPIEGDSEASNTSEFGAASSIKGIPQTVDTETDVLLKEAASPAKGVNFSMGNILQNSTLIVGNTSKPNETRDTNASNTTAQPDNQAESPNPENTTELGAKSKDKSSAVNKSIGLINESEADVIEPVSEENTQGDKGSWQGKKKKAELAHADGTTRQEDTELGIFRPDEL